MQVSPEYLAGFFDGEGYVGVIHHKNYGYYTLRATITNTELLPLQLIQKEFGGKINRHDYQDTSHKMRYVLIWHGEDAKTILKQILPHSIIKASQIVIALNFPIGKQQGRVKTTDENRKKQIEIYNELQKRKSFNRPRSLS